MVQPFNLVTPDNATLYAWHVLPLHLYKKHEHELLANEKYGVAEDVTQTAAFKLLAKDPNARVIVNRPAPNIAVAVHGNAANLGAGYRPSVYRNFLAMSTPSHPVHVIAFDYRGFGVSTGTPTEEGLIVDALTVINYLTSPPLSVSPSRIAVVGQSLGTAVAAGLADRLAFGNESPVKTLAGIVLIAPFSNIPKLLESYSLMGIFPPILSPLMGYPQYKKYVLNRIIDKWDTASRLARLTGVLPKSESDAKYNEKDFNLIILHAANDPDIPWHEGKRTWDAAVGGEKATQLGNFIEVSASSDNVTEVKVWERRVGSALKRVRWEKVRYGGHNKIASLSLAAVAVMRVFDEK
ncbi:alpha/beta hydrolase family protein [Emydomyces testavorans]|uniref:Alpha/beta hydrolase family protein n=1 Tax=Emydomyces testavorans TaxID=2070801 RepID=A0AAF0DJ35_9EURO|nr:alpha/beta hydrolase family protein [Emydomyces testavorans]